ncbi:BTB/POZ protein [Xylariaceae sp. FL1651]|nr:BTB/POZ protein [Xylariaceae sp. FL1651]
MDQKTDNSLYASLRKYFDNDVFSDATIRCGEQEFKVHALILSAQSEFFAKSFSGPWKESQGGKQINLEDVDVSVVEAMLYFMYHFEYSNVYGASTMVFNAQVYSIADRYIVPALKKYAKEKFSSAIRCGWSMDDFPLAIAEAYSSTPEEDRGLRDLVVETCNKNLNQLSKNQAFREALQATVGFAADLVLFKTDSVDRWGCPSCGHVMYEKFSTKSTGRCTNCGYCR